MTRILVCSFMGMLLTWLGISHATHAIAAPFQVIGQAKYAFAQSERKLQTIQIRQTALREHGEEGIKHIEKLPRILPYLVDCLSDPSKEIRFTAVKAIHAAARKVDRLTYWTDTPLDWPALEPHFLRAHDRLGELKVYSRTQRLVSQLLERKGAESGKTSSQSRATPAIHPLGTEATQLLDELCRLREDQIVEMWRLTKARMPEFDAHTQASLFKEMLSVANPRYFEFALMLTDDFDDAIIEATLNYHFELAIPSDDTVNPSELIHTEPTRELIAQQLILHHAKPQSAELIRRMVDLLEESDEDLAKTEGLSRDFRTGLVACLSNCEQLPGTVADQVTESLIQNPKLVRKSEFYHFLMKKKQDVAPELMESVIQQGIQTIRDSSSETWERSEAISSLSNVAPGHSGLLQCAKEILGDRLGSNEELLRETLLSLPAHGAACKSVTSQLLKLTQSQDEIICQCAIESLEKVSGIDQLAIENLVERIKSNSESQDIKVAIGKILKSNGEAASQILHKHLLKELQAEAGQRVVVDLLRAVENISDRHDSLNALCRELAGDPTLPLMERLAALHTSSTCSKDRQASIPFLSAILHSPEESIEVKAAAIQAIATLAKSNALSTLEEFKDDNSELLACAARHGFHLAGESNKAVHLLMEQYLQSDLPSTLEEIFYEIGKDGEAAFYETLESSSSTPDQKQIAYRVLASSESPDWNRLLVHLENEATADQFEESLRTSWNFDLNIIPSLFQQIEDAPVDSAIAARAWGLADDFTSGLGAEGESAAAPTAMRRAIAYSASVAPHPDVIAEIDSNPPAGGGIPPALMEPPAIEKPIVLAPIPAPSPAPTASMPRSSENSAYPPRAVQTPLESTNHVTLDPGVLRSVEVFFGTNRQPNYTTTFGSRLKWGAFSIAIISLMVCLFGFAYQRLVAYSVAAMFGLLGIAMLANDSLDISYWFPDLARTYSGNYSDEVKLGVCEVTIPKTHVAGQLESPSLFLKLELRPDPSKHIVLKETKVLSESEFFEKLHTTLDEQGKNLLVFIHGYNVSFEDAARRTAQMSVDLKFKGAPVFYSWPSYSDWYRYPDDAQNIQRSVVQIRQFLEKLAKDSGATSINLVAHSMGNVGLTQALAGLDSQTPLFNQVVLAAPDIDATVFANDIAPKLTTKAKRVTLYTSQTDLALLASRYFNSGARVGDSSYGVRVFPGIETIDATSIDSSLLGHSYYGSNVNVLEDIANLFSERPIADRSYLHIIEDVSPPYWAFSRAPRVAGTELQPAL